MNILIVDDEKLALSRLQRILNNLGFCDIVACDDAFGALEAAKKTLFDVVFLDISMPDMDGLELAEKILQLEPKTFVIFQSAHDNFALKAYQSGGIDYLLKPIDESSVQKSIKKVEQYIAQDGDVKKKIMGKNGSHFYLINIEDIYYIKADLDEVIVRIKEAQTYVKKKISDFDMLLKDKNFYRVHRSYIVNIDKIRSMTTVEQSKLQISFYNIEDIVTSSKDGAKEFREYLERRSL
jgi:two-component system LytT family response regulator